MRKAPNVTRRVEQAYEIIRDSICDCSLAPGTHLVQEDLATNIGVSRQPIQQAMLLLKADGLVIETGARGLYVAPMDPDSIIFHYQIRTQMDRLASHLVAERAAQAHAFEFRARLAARGEELVAQGKRANEQTGAVAAVALDMQFHRLIYELSGNPLIHAAAEPHWNFLRRVMISVLLHAGRGDTVWTEHEIILNQLLAGDSTVADTVESHILGAQSALLDTLGR